MRMLIDASSAIHAWTNYPIDKFSEVWKWIKKEIHDQNIQSINEIIGETEKKDDGLHRWLLENNIYCIPASNAILQFALRINQFFEINDGDSVSSGVGKNDVLLISAAKLSRLEIITNEAVQIIKPGNKPPNQRLQGY